LARLIVVHGQPVVTAWGTVGSASGNTASVTVRGQSWDGVRVQGPLPADGARVLLLAEGSDVFIIGADANQQGQIDMSRVTGLSASLNNLNNNEGTNASRISANTSNINFHGNQILSLIQAAEAHGWSV
jgi:hypothetical protein